MKLLTKELQANIPHLYATEKQADPMVVVKFFTPDSNWTWYITEGQPEGYNDWRFFGLVAGHEVEMGYVLLSELESARGPLGLKIERDLHWTPTPLSEVKKAEYAKR